MTQLCELRNWPGLLKPRSKAEWHRLLGNFIRHAKELPDDALELLAQIAEQGPEARRGRPPGRPADRFLMVHSYVAGSRTKGAAVREMAMLRYRPGAGEDQVLRAREAARKYVQRNGKWSYQSGEAPMYREAVRQAMQRKAEREAEEARQDAELAELLAGEGGQ
jgi:hypothetical protein